MYHCQRRNHVGNHYTPLFWSPRSIDTRTQGISDQFHRPSYAHVLLHSPRVPGLWHPDHTVTPRGKTCIEDANLICETETFMTMTEMPAGLNLEVV